MITEKGTIRYRGEIKSGTSKNGNDWAFQDIVLEVPTGSSQYKNLLVRADIHTVGEIQNISDSQEVEVTYYVNAREYNGKWYPDVNLYSIKVVGEQHHTGGSNFEKKTYDPVGSAPSPAPKKKVDVDNDLPFD